MHAIKGGLSGPSVFWQGITEGEILKKLRNWSTLIVRDGFVGFQIFRILDY